MEVEDFCVACYRPAETCWCYCPNGITTIKLPMRRCENCHDKDNLYKEFPCRQCNHYQHFFPNSECKCTCIDACKCPGQYCNQDCFYYEDDVQEKEFWKMYKINVVKKEVLKTLRYNATIKKLEEEMQNIRNETLLTPELLDRYFILKNRHNKLTK